MRPEDFVPRLVVLDTAKGVQGSACMAPSVRVGEGGGTNFRYIREGVGRPAKLLLDSDNRTSRGHAGII